LFLHGSLARHFRRQAEQYSCNLNYLDGQTIPAAIFAIRDRLHLVQ
jgi:hypothetical protein